MQPLAIHWWVPEGDSIRRDAAKLAALVGQRIERATTQGLVRDLAGRVVTAVTPYGKHLTIVVDDGTELRVHRGIRGSFTATARADGEAWLARLSPGRASLALIVADAVYLWRDARTVEISPRRGARRGIAVAQLGLDVLADDFDSRLAASRARLHATRIVCDVLLDQRVVAGIGNIYKNEALFLCRIDPRAPISVLTDAQLDALYATANRLMKVSSRDFFVYGRTGEPCRTCRTTLQLAQLGDPPRWTWSCPQCQGQPTTDHANG